MNQESLEFESMNYFSVSVGMQHAALSHEKEVIAAHKLGLLLFEMHT